MEYAQIQQNKVTGQKFINLKKNGLLMAGDWVQIKLIPDELMNEEEK